MAATKLPKASKSFVHPEHEPRNPLMRAHSHEDEAPDWGDPEPEAPEGRLSQAVEAPDAGDSRGSYLETEFTHGRSQS